jgi:hypothetical protein
MLIGVDVFDPTRYWATSMLVSLAPDRDPAPSRPRGWRSGLPVASGSMPSIVQRNTPPSPQVTTGRACTVVGAPGRVVRPGDGATLDRDVPTLLRAKRSYVRCSPLGAAIAGTPVCASTARQSCPFERMTNR